MGKKKTGYINLDKKFDHSSEFGRRCLFRFQWTRLAAIMFWHNINGNTLAITCAQMADESDDLEAVGIYQSAISNYKNGNVKWCKLPTLRKIAGAIAHITKLAYTVDDIDEDNVVKERYESKQEVS